MADYVIAPLSSDGAPAIALLSLEAHAASLCGVLDRADYCDVHFEDALADGVTLLAEGEKRRGSCATALDALGTAFGLIELAGLMQRVTEMTAEYISNRVQFGQPIAKFQAARHHAADMLMQTQTTRWAAYHALDCFEKATPTRPESGWPSTGQSEPRTPFSSWRICYTEASASARSTRCIS